MTIETCVMCGGRAYERAVQGPSVGGTELSATMMIGGGRASGVFGDDLETLLSGEGGRVARLWREKRGVAEPRDLPSSLPIALADWTRPFNRAWYEQRTGLVVNEVCSVWRDILHPWRCALLDGFVEEKKAIWQAEHASAFASAEEIVSHAMPRLQHDMAVAGVGTAILSVIYGNDRWEAYEIDADGPYQDRLLDIERRFWTCVLNGEVPPTASLTDDLRATDCLSRFVERRAVRLPIRTAGSYREPGSMCASPVTTWEIAA
jgi:predicted phage-related endonuclease